MYLLTIIVLWSHGNIIKASSTEHSRMHNLVKNKKDDI